MASHENHDTDVILTLPRDIVVRAYRIADAASLSKHANNKRIWDNLRNRMPHPYTVEASKSWITSCNSPDNQQKSGSWAVETGATGPLVPINYCVEIAGEPCGSIGLQFNDPEEIYFRKAEVGYWLGEDYWGKGIMSIVVPAFVDWTWRTFGVLIRLDSDVLATNIGSKRCLEKAGFVVEGLRKAGYVKNGEVKDELLLGMLRPGLDLP